MAERRVLVLGGGGREHALAMTLARAPSVGSVLVAPGNAGCIQRGRGHVASIERLELAIDDPTAVVAAAKANDVDLVVVGPEAPLCHGVVDASTAAGVLAFGPTAAAARLEGSKAYMKRFALERGIPTAPFIITSDYAEAARYIDASERARVVKADGLAGGKGAVVARSSEEAKAAARSMLLGGRFGDAGRTVVIEDLLEGVEMSVHVVTDGEGYLVLPVARDYKRVNDGGVGPNTGGMGAIGPVAVDAKLMRRIEKDVIQPTLEGMREAGTPYRGVLYAGVMVAKDGTPNLLEHNVRFGDPETQVLVHLLDGDLAELMASAAAGKLDQEAVTVGDRHAIVVVMAADGYPGSPRKGDLVGGLEQAAMLEGVRIVHAGTDLQGGALVTNGGRVLGVVAVGDSAEEARSRAYRATDKLSWPGIHFRRDIGT